MKAELGIVLYCACQSVFIFIYRPNQVAEKVAARIAENFGETAIVMVITTRGLDEYERISQMSYWSLSNFDFTFPSGG